MSQFAFSIAFWASLFASFAQGAEIHAVSAKLRLGTTVQHGYRGRSNGGLVYGAENALRSTLVFLTADGYPVSSYPVIVTFRSLGATAIVGSLDDREISLGRVNDRTVRQILGTYYGLRLGAAFLLQAQASVAMNRHGVMMRNMAVGEGLGVDVSVPAITIHADGNSGLDDRIRIRR